MTKNQPKQEETKEQTVLGFVAKDNINPEITFPQFFQLMLAVENVNKLLMQIKQTNFNNDNMRYYFESDLEDVKDEKGNVVMTKNNKGESVPSKTLKADFWEPKQETK